MEENKKSTGNFNHADFQQIIDIMNQDNKYYTPSFEEICCGLEVEIQYPYKLVSDVNT